MKVVKLEWGFMTSTIRRPVVVAPFSKPITLVGFEKGEGQMGGRFPVMFGVFPDDAEVKHVTHHRGEPAPEGGITMNDVDSIYVIKVRDIFAAESLAAKISSSPRVYEDRDVVLSPDGREFRKGPGILDPGTEYRVFQKGHPVRRARIEQVPEFGSDAGTRDHCARCVAQYGKSQMMLCCATWSTHGTVCGRRADRKGSVSWALKYIN